MSAIASVSVPSFRSDGVSLHYEEFGEGEPVLLLHGFTSSFAGTWKHTGWVDLLTASGRRAVGLDFPSHGGSEPVYDARRCTPERLCADVHALLDRLSLDRADVLGFSMGAGVALRLAMSHPSRVAKLALGGIGDAALNGLHDPHQIAELAAAFQLESGETWSYPGSVSTSTMRSRRVSGGTQNSLTQTSERCCLSYKVTAGRAVSARRCRSRLRSFCSSPKGSSTWRRQTKSGAGCDTLRS